jgi:hypothetical protein
MLSVFIVESPSWQGDIALPTELCRLPAGAIKLQFRKTKFDFSAAHADGSIAPLRDQPSARDD